MKIASMSAFVSGGPLSIVVFGGVVSATMLHVQVAGVRSNKRSVCDPNASPSNVAGCGHAVNAVAESRRHWYVVLNSFDENVNVGVALSLGFAGPSMIVVSGAVTSTIVQE